MLKYKITGRFTNGNTVPAYYMECSDFSKSGRYNREQVIMLAAKGQIVNCTVALAPNGVHLHGVGVNLNDLPSKPDQTSNIVKPTGPSTPKGGFVHNGVAFTPDMIKKIGNANFYNSVVGIEVQDRYKQVYFNCYGPDSEFFDATMSYNEIYGYYDRMFR